MHLFPLNRQISKRVTPFLKLLSLSPNQVTLLSLASGLLGCWGFFQGTHTGWIWGALFVQAAYVLDNCDGELARLTGRSSGLGSWLDVVSDCLIHIFFFLGLGWGLSRSSGDLRWGQIGQWTAAGVALTYITFFIEQIQLRGRSAWIHPDPLDVGEIPLDFWGKVRKVFREDFSLVVLVSALGAQVHWLLVSGLMGAFVYFLLNLLSIGAKGWRVARPQMVRTLGFLAGIFLFVWVLRQSDLQAVFREVLGLQWRFLLVLLFYIVIFGLDTLGWKFVLKREGQSNIRWDRLFRARLAGEAVNYVTPSAWVGGEPVKAYLLSKRYGIPMSDGIASVVIAKTTFSISMFLFILAGLVVTLLTRSLEASLLRWVWVALSLLGGLLTLFLVVQFLRPFERGAGIAAAFLPGWPHHLKVSRWLRSMGAKVQEWDKALISFYRASPKAVLLSLAFHFLGWMAGVVEVYLILQFLHIPVTWLTAWSIEALWVLLKTSAFLIPASLGASEGISLLVCAALGLSTVSGLALALIRRARELIWVGLGLVEFARE